MLKNKKKYKSCRKIINKGQMFCFFVVFFLLGNLQRVEASQIPQEYLKKIELKDRIYAQEIDFSRHQDFFDVYTKYYYKGQEVKLGSGAVLSEYVMSNYDIKKEKVLGISRGAIENFIRVELIPKYNRKMQPVRIYRNPENNEIEFEGFAMDGRKIKVNLLTDMIIYAIQNEVHTLIIPFEDEPAQVTVDDEELKKNGIKELVSMGESDYSYSSWKRITNITIGSSSFNGKLLQKDEIFSIAKYLGRITSAKGYKSELVIKGTETIPELGGGLCQVATTVFRSALLGGFEIVERWPHAYAVFHYEPFGSDATIYPPSKDIKFKNNTAGAILLQSYMDASTETLYVNIYGTKDVREVKVLGPFIWHWKYPGAHKFETDPNKKYWQNRILNEYYNGFSVYWKREVTVPEEGTGSDVLTLTGATLPIYEFKSVYKPAF